MKTVTETIWLLRADVQMAILDKNKELFGKIVNVLGYYMLDSRVVDSNLATSYDNDKLLSAAEVIQPLISNVKNLQEYRFGNKSVNFSFGEELCPIHSIWVLRSKFERFKYGCETESNLLKKNFELYKEIINSLKLLLELLNNCSEEKMAIQSILKEVDACYMDYVYVFSRRFPKR